MGTTEVVRAPRTGGRELAPLVPLALVTGISPLATDMYIPGLPELAADLGTTPAVAQLTLTAFLVSFAVGQLLIGPLSDAVGRRRLVLLGTFAFVVASVLCAVSPTAPVLLAARVLQGLAGAAGSVAGRAMVTDVLAGVRRARVIAALSAINAVGPVVAPLIGGALLGVGTWRLTFWALAAVGLALAVSVLVSFPETLPAERRSAGSACWPAPGGWGRCCASRASRSTWPPRAWPRSASSPTSRRAPSSSRPGTATRPRATPSSSPRTRPA
ncbi:hypothetical protein GCM10009593_18470 [Microlunatus antarcticus]|uniref:Multidrug resistance protein n=1 Tax=Microlunatus antarcticus TaxID=53388 RepID=A0A7W5P6V0_9ACTN|nr:multidrug resistance protein [Microlunatus antarcticus]